MSTAALHMTDLVLGESNVQCMYFKALTVNAVMLLHDGDDWMLRCARLVQHFQHSLLALSLQCHNFLQT